MNWNLGLVGIVLIFAAAILILFNSNTIPPTDQLCDVNGSISTLLCYWNNKSQIFYSYNNFRQPKCGDYAFAVVNITKFNIPSQYYLCMSALALNTANDSFDGISDGYINRSSMLGFFCNQTVLFSNVSSTAWNGGFIPNITGRQVFLSMYVYDASAARNYTFDDFMSNANSSNKIVSLEGTVIC